MITLPHFVRLRRSYRNWWREIHRVLPTELPEPFFCAENIKAVHEFFSTCTAANDGLPETPSELNGNCFICNEPVAFTVDIPEDGGPVNWRETLTCPQCGLINRWRGCLHIFAALFEPTRFDRIYLTETLTPVYQNLASRFSLLSGSEFFPDLESGGWVQTHTMAVRNEDVTSLTFADSSLEAVLCFDVLEHVPDYRSALKEFYRVLGSGGQLLISVPFSFKQETLVRAMLDDADNIKHLMEPCYHGDPLSDQGVLSYYDFGMELLEEMREAGFQECFLVCYHSKKWGYFDHNVAFVGRKLRTGRYSHKIIRSVWKWSCAVKRNSAQRIAALFKSTALYARRRLSFLMTSRSPEYTTRMQNEQGFFKNCTEVHDLPDIFHYWSNKYLAPDMSRFGFTNPDDFFTHHIRDFLSHPDHPKTRILSIGSGNCDLEVKIAGKLLEWGLENFVIECLDINKDMLKRGELAAGTAGVNDHLLFTRGDFNRWKPAKKYGIVIANQSLHHVMNLEGLFDAIKQSLEPDGQFLVCDMIGRNGHMRWPEAMETLKPFWNELPDEYRNNRLMNRHEQQYINHDCSSQGFEGIRAQDILPLLLERFNFNFFYPFGNIIFVFIDRPFGHNFDAGADWDKDFVDRVHARDEASLIAGDMKPTSMLAVLTCSEAETVLRHPALSPQRCVRTPGNRPD